MKCGDKNREICKFKNSIFLLKNIFEPYKEFVKKIKKKIDRSKKILIKCEKNDELSEI